MVAAMAAMAATVPQLMPPTVSQKLALVAVLVATLATAVSELELTNLILAELEAVEAVEAVDLLTLVKQAAVVVLDCWVRGPMV
jgi:hypothetical protein